MQAINAGGCFSCLSVAYRPLTSHQEHPGTGISVQGIQTEAVNLERLVKGIGITDLKVVDAFDVKALRAGVKSSLGNAGLSVIIVRGACAIQVTKKPASRGIDMARCDLCGVCLLVGCPAIQREDGRIHIDFTLCVGDTCAICQQLCPRQAISPQFKIPSES